MFDTVLFDLDGTITDPGMGITNSVMHALKKFGIIVDDRAQLYKFIGPPLYESFEKYYGFSNEQAHTAVDYYREYYADIGIFENIVYDGVKEMLEALLAAGKRAVIATSKPEIFARRIIEHFSLEGYFAFIAGATLDGSLLDKGDVIAYALGSLKKVDKSKVLMVGDRMHDIMGAKKNGLKSAGVLYGYGSREELEGAGADYIISSPEEILNLI